MQQSDLFIANLWWFMHSFVFCVIHDAVWVSVPKLQSCLGVGVENSGPKKTVRVEILEENMAWIGFI